MSAGGLSRHLRACAERRAAGERAEGGGGTPQRLLHLLVRDAHGCGCWLHLEMNGQATLWDLDWYLRRIWLDCCGHMSGFRIGDREFLESLDDFDDGLVEDINVQADAVLSRGLAFTHQYDFGTTTETRLRVVDERTGKPTTEGPIALMARNEPVPIPCSACGRPASVICLDCHYRDFPSGYACDEHVALHVGHDDYGELRVFNSPRTGVCAYSGPAEPPW